MFIELQSAIDILKSRYGNENRIIRAHIRALLELPSITRSSDVELKRVLNEIDTHVRSLATFGVSSSKYGFFLTQIILSRLPLGLRMLWARHDCEKLVV